MRPIWLFAFLVFFAAPCAAGIHLGVTAGVNNTSITGDELPNIELSSQPGAAFGLIGEFDLAPDVRLSIQPSFVQKKTGVAYEVEGETELVDSLEVATDYFRVPVLLKIMAVNGRTFVNGGVDAGFLSGATLTGRGEDEDVKSIFEDIDLAAVFGFGVTFPIGKPTLTVEARYTQSLNNIANADRSEDELPGRFRFTGFQLFAGILFSLGGAE